MLAIVAWAAVSTPQPVVAGQIFGHVTRDGRSVGAGVQIRVACGGDAFPPVQTNGDGYYEIYVPSVGECQIQIDYENQSPTYPVISYQDPVRYSFDIAGQGGNLVLTPR